MSKMHNNFDKKAVDNNCDVRNRRKQNSGRLSASLILLAATCGWITVLFCVESGAQAWNILYKSFLTTLCCCICHHLVSMVTTPRDSLVFSHFLCGSLVYLCYVQFYCSKPDFFLQTWRSLYFGFYIWDICAIILYWNRLFPAFRHFYTVHHTVSFVITGTWAYAGGEWLDYIILGLVIWLSSDIWVYALSAYRAGPFPKLAQHELSSYRYKIFWIERVHRLLAYVLPLWVVFSSGSYPSMLCFLVLGTGLANDALDATFQWKAILKARKQQSRTFRVEKLALASVRNTCA